MVDYILMLFLVAETEVPRIRPSSQGYNMFYWARQSAIITAYEGINKVVECICTGVGS